MKYIVAISAACVICLCATIISAQTSPADSSFNPGDSIPPDTIPSDSLPPGTGLAFQSRIMNINYANGVVTFTSVQFIAQTTPLTRYHNQLADSAGLNSFVPDQMVLVAGRMALADTVIVDSMIALNFLPTDTTYVPQQIIVHLGLNESLSNIAGDQSLNVIDSIPELRLYLLQSIASGIAIDSLALKYISDPAIEQIDANYLVGAPEGVQSSQPFIDLQAKGDFSGQIATKITNLAGAQQLSSGANISAAIIDGGIDRTHPLFTGQTIDGYDYLDNDYVPDDSPGGPGYGHGTFIAGLVKLIAPEVKLYAYRVLDSTGRGNGFNVAKAIVQAIRDSCRVINLSMTMRQPHLAIEQAILYAWNADAITIAAAGNDSSSLVVYPAADDHVISVAAVDSTYRKAFFSSYGPTVDICAPGNWVYAPFPADKFAWWNGTSFAVPFVTGQVALLWSKFPLASLSDIRRAITATAIPIDSYNPGLQGQLGAGLINLQSSLADFPQFPCGDVNGNGFGPDLEDMALLIGYLSQENVTLPYPDLANLDGSPGSIIDLSDLSILVSYLVGYTSAPVCH